MVDTLEKVVARRNAASDGARKSWGDKIVRAKRIVAQRAAALRKPRSRVTVTPASRISAISTRAAQSTKVEAVLPDFMTPAHARPTATKIVAALAAAGEITSAHGVATTGSALRSGGVAAVLGRPSRHDELTVEKNRKAADKFGALPITFESVAARPWSPANARKNSALFLQRAAERRSSSSASSLA